MNKAELIAKVADDAGLTKVSAARAVAAFTDAVQGELKKGKGVALVGFGTFSTGKRAARTGLNPRTREAIKIPAKKVVKFRAGAGLKKAVNKK